MTAAVHELHPRDVAYTPHLPEAYELPPELVSLPHWVAWKLVQRPGKAKPDKVPISPRTGAGAAWTDPQNQVDFETARAYAERHRLHGVGVVLNAGGTLAGLDLDSCRDPKTGALSDLAREVVREAATYFEVSPGLSGIRGLFFGDFGGHTGRDETHGVELYEAGRFLTITGRHLPDTPWLIAHRDLAELGRRYFGKKAEHEMGPPRDGIPAWRQVDVDALAIDGELRKRIRQGDASRHGGDRSTALFIAAKDLLRAGVSDADACCVLCDPANEISEAALERRGGDLASAMQWTWSYGIVPARRAIDGERKEFAAVGLTPDRGALSDDGLALVLAAQLADRTRWVQGWGVWLHWDGAVWVRDGTLATYDLVRALCRRAAAAAETEGRAKELRKATTVAAVERMARSDRRLAAVSEQWDADPWAINTPAGIVNLRDGTRRPHDPLAYCTKITAVAPAGDCPRWRQFLAEVTDNDTDLAAFLQRVAGYGLTGAILEHALFFLYGTGRNGKGVFLNALKAVLDAYATIAPMTAFTDTHHDQHPTDLAMLRGARLVIAQETEEGRNWAESRIKALTGGDPITARFMRQDFFTFTPQFKLLIAGNHKPTLRNVDEAIRGRLHLIPFTVTIPPEQRDPSLPDKLKAEWPGILQWAIEGCLDYQRKGLAPPRVVTDATADYLAAQDSFSAWLAEACEFGTDYTAAVGALFTSWGAWAEANRVPAGSIKRFASALDRAGFPQSATRPVTGGRWRVGLRLRSEFSTAGGQECCPW